MVGSRGGGRGAGKGSAGKGGVGKTGSGGVARTGSGVAAQSGRRLSDAIGRGTSALREVPSAVGNIGSSFVGGDSGTLVPGKAATVFCVRCSLDVGEDSPVLSRAAVAATSLAIELTRLTLGGGIIGTEAAYAAVFGDGLLFKGLDGFSESFAVGTVTVGFLTSALSASFLIVNATRPVPLLGAHRFASPLVGRTFTAFAAVAALELLELVVLAGMGIFKCTEDAAEWHCDRTAMTLHALAWPLALLACLSRTAVALVAWRELALKTPSPYWRQPYALPPPRGTGTRERHLGERHLGEQAPDRLQTTLEPFSTNDLSLAEDILHQVLQRRGAPNVISRAPLAASIASPRKLTEDLPLELQEEVATHSEAHVGTVAAIGMGSPLELEPVTTLATVPRPRRRSFSGRRPNGLRRRSRRGSESDASGMSDGESSRASRDSAIDSASRGPFKSRYCLHCLRLLEECRDKYRDLEGDVRRRLQEQEDELARRCSELNSECEHIRGTLEAQRCQAESHESSSPRIDSVDTVAAVSQLVLRSVSHDLEKVRRAEEQTSGLKVRCDVLKERVDKIEKTADVNAVIGERLDQGMKTVQRGLTESLVMQPPLDDARKLALKLLQQAFEVAALLCAEGIRPGERADMSQEIRKLREKHKSTQKFREVLTKVLAKAASTSDTVQQDVLAKPGKLSSEAVKSVLREDLVDTGSWASHPSPDRAALSPDFAQSPHASLGFHPLHTAMPLHISEHSPVGAHRHPAVMAAASLQPGQQHTTAVASPLESPSPLPHGPLSHPGHTLPADAGQVLVTQPLLQASLPNPGHTAAGQLQHQDIFAAPHEAPSPLPQAPLPHPRQTHVGQLLVTQPLPQAPLSHSGHTMPVAAGQLQHHDVVASLLEAQSPLPQAMLPHSGLTMPAAGF